MNYTAVVCVLVVCIVACVGMLWMAYHQNKLSKSTRAMVVDERNKALEAAESALEAEKFMVDLLANVLYGLAHTDNGYAIAWKLQSFRQVERVVLSHGYAKDADTANWITETLRSQPMENQEEFMKKARSFVEDYYIMDMDEGEDLYGIMRQLIILQEKRNRDGKDVAETKKKLDDLIDAAKFRLPIVDTKEKPVTVNGRFVEDALQRLEEVLKDGGGDFVIPPEEEWSTRGEDYDGEVLNVVSIADGKDATNTKEDTNE